MKFFNTVGPIDPERHYFIPKRLNWQQLSGFIEKQYYFVLHAPRQSGKTTAIIEFVKHLNEENKFTALYMSTESARAATHDPRRATEILLAELHKKISVSFTDQKEALNYINTLLNAQRISESGVTQALSFWAKHNQKPLVIFLDEFDGLVGDTLISLLTQIRTGYTDRPKHFPQTICLIGVRDLRDYQVLSENKKNFGVLYSPFNIKAESIVLPNFSLEQIQNLYQQHTQETGQKFTDEAVSYTFHVTQGQPWLVNALAYQACFRDHQDRTQTITKEIIELAKDVLIARRDTHIDALAERLKEPKVRSIMDAIISGGDVQNFPSTDVSYVTDLGLIKKESFEIANPIYKEIIPRELTAVKQRGLTFERSWYIRADGLLDIPKFLAAFTQFFREGSADWLKNFNYQESGPHLLVMAYLQRVVNGGGKINREYALGRKRVDLMIEWPAQEPQQRIVIELKIYRDSRTLPEALQQTASYMDSCNATEGHIMIFDRDATKNWDEKIYHHQEHYEGKSIDVWGL